MEILRTSTCVLVQYCTVLYSRANESMATSFNPMAAALAQLRREKRRGGSPGTAESQEIISPSAKESATPRATVVPRDDADTSRHTGHSLLIPRHFKAGASTELEILQDPSGSLGGGHGATVWDSAIVLAGHLVLAGQSGGQGKHTCRGKRVLELGAGCGLVGLAASTLSASEVVLTDLPRELKLLRRNVEHNKLRKPGRECLVSVAELDWEDVCRCGDSADVKGTFDLILGADIMYDRSIATALAATIRMFSSHDTVVLIAHEHRKHCVDRSFLESFENCGLAWTSIAAKGNRWEGDISVFELSLPLLLPM